MPFTANIFNPCLLPAESSIMSTVPSRSSSSFKSIFCRYFLQKRSRVIREPHPVSSTRNRGSNLVREVNSKNKSRSKCQSTNSYDMTILHDDELENTQLATIRRRKKKIPSWANKEQLQLAIINQVYFHEKTPEEIFGSICIEHVFDMINSIDVRNNGTTSMVVSRTLI